ncbi:MAG: polyribonucleotide nucleotidyltransferase [Pelagibacteraceae bacterium]|nr:polyribonucleotide nucleotidyltransferase [Pelagibacteraceae bacterium]MBO6481194.1 polyribonucleotide nucleotidyltransferase [Pelagibacteraceae bacterium]MBO6483164.1 polyribonucleotide nucleotidyltransferase [Pelagibacteraceae bacterium]MBO6484269.1 polyribonucleotide nucleotidyltransferase [Pelagibacteraceae bacterium]MBO6487130.1 polyribonucleotide nucleotidyltransferase [Pelagibacteraceae bacterium]
MFKQFKEEIDFAGKKLTLETGKIARQADGAIIATCGETVVISTVVGAKKVNPETDYFPLQVNYQEKYYAAGKIPGGYFKREARPTESETLISRLIDRPIRPLFPEGFRNEVQILPTVLSYDNENEADILSIIASSAALSISGLPFKEPIAASRVGYIDNNYVLNPSKEQLKESKLDLVVAGTKEAVLMVESEASGLTEKQMLDAVKFGHEKFIPVIKAIESLAKKSSKEAWKIEEKDYSKLKNKISKELTKDLEKAFSEKDKKKRSELVNLASEKCKSLFEGDDTYSELEISLQLKNLEKDIVRTKILKSKKRIDGRGLSDVRPIKCEVGVLPRTHGSALFTRGETQALVTTTLGTTEDEQRIESLEGQKRVRFMLHYNFPPFSVGETGRIGTGRREVGHGKLAWRALNSSLPEKEKFPYTLRIVSEITESNGSSSMATVCGASLALMDAAVPIAEPVAGIAMGLIKEKKEFSVLSDILGDEDHLGDMDFKVAGTKDGITSLQMDIKITGITFEIMEQALNQAKDGRAHILTEMNKAIKSSRNEVSKYTPKIETIKVDKKDIAAVIGKGGATIREIVELSGAKVDVKDTGEVTIAAPDEESRKKAMEMVKSIVAKPEVGKTYKGKVVKIMEFGAFVNFLGKQDGLVHISQLATKRVEKVTDVVKEGDEVSVKVIGFDRGKVKLSMKGTV